MVVNVTLTAEDFILRNDLLSELSSILFAIDETGELLSDFAIDNIGFDSNTLVNHPVEPNLWFLNMRITLRAGIKEPQADESTEKFMEMLNTFTKTGGYKIIIGKDLAFFANDIGEEDIEEFEATSLPKIVTTALGPDTQTTISQEVTTQIPGTDKKFPVTLG